LALIVVIAASLAAGVAAFAEIHEPPGEDATPIARSSVATPPSSPAEHVERGSGRARHRVDPYRHTRANEFSPAVRGIPERVYVPDNTTDTVTVIDAKTFTIVDVYPVGSFPQHVTPRGTSGASTWTTADRTH
jgi:hypothetical protein